MLTLLYGSGLRISEALGLTGDALPGGGETVLRIVGKGGKTRLAPVLPVAWTVLYLMMAVAGWLIWETPHPSRPVLLAVWGAQLLLNALWSYIFFGRKDIGLALAELSGLWVLIAVFVVLAWPVNREAALLFLPYLAWVSYAGALNAAIWRRNPVRG